MLTDGWYMLTACTICCVNMVTANWGKVCTPFTRSAHPHGICGRRIDETLDLLCSNGFNEIPSYNFRRRRRDNTENFEGNINNQASDFLIPRKDAHSFLVKRSSYYERGIVCECCYHSCSIMELLSYCRGGGGLFGLFKRSIRAQEYKQMLLNTQPHLPEK